MAALTFSKIDLAGHCQWWCRPDIELPQSDENEYSRKGTDAHVSMQRLGSLSDAVFARLYGCDVNHAKSIQSHLLQQVESLCSGYKCRTEVAFAYNTSNNSAREISNERQRDYGILDESEIAGTFDLVGVEGTRGLVIDWKFGRQANLNAASESGQLLSGALCLSSVHNLEQVRIAYVFPDCSGNIDISESSVDVFDMADFTSYLGNIVTLKNSEPQPHPGPWCKSKWCPAIKVCPSAKLVSDGMFSLSNICRKFPFVLRADDITCPEHAATLHTQITLAKAFTESYIDQAKNALHSWLLKNGPVDTIDGKKLGVIAKTGRETIDLDEKGITVLRDLLGDEADATVITHKVSTTKEKIESAIKKLQTTENKKDFKKRVFDELRAVGNCKQSAPYDVVDFFTPKET